jgi:hypothetical protein
MLTSPERSNSALLYMVADMANRRSALAQHQAFLADPRVPQTTSGADG